MLGLGHERLTDLVLVCRDCHNEIHEYAKENPTVGLWIATSKVRRRHEQTEEDTAAEAETESESY